jgi:hypothetical protein
MLHYAILGHGYFDNYSLFHDIFLEVQRKAMKISASLEGLQAQIWT